MGAKRTEIHSLGFGCWEEVCGTIKTANPVQHPGGIYGSKAYRNPLPGFWVLGGDLRNYKNSKFRTAPGRDLWEQSVQKSPPWVLGAGRRFAEL